MRSWPIKVVTMEFRKILAYRSDFWVNFFGQMIIQLLVARALWSEIFHANGASEMRGMTLTAITLHYLIAPLGIKAIMGENIGFLSREIYEGGLNRFIVWPVSPLGYKFLTYMSYVLFYILQITLLMLLAGSFMGHSPETSDQWLKFFVGLALLTLAGGTYFCLSALTEMVSFWQDNVWSLGVMLRFSVAFLGGAFLPMPFFPFEMRLVLEMTPFPAMIGTPAALILGSASWADAWNALVVLSGWTVVLSLAVAFVWKKGNYSYTGVGM